jgi:4,5-epoxidase
MLDTYQAERRPQATEVLSGTTAATNLLFSHSPLVRLLRDRIAVRLLQSPRLQRQLTYRGSQLGMTYRRGPLGAGFHIGGGLRSGDRVPDRLCRDQESAGTRLYAKLGGCWALLGPHGAAGTCVDVARRRLGDSLETLTSERDTPADVMLVRPTATWRGGDETPPVSSGGWRERWATGEQRDDKTNRTREARRARARPAP